MMLINSLVVAFAALSGVAKAYVVNSPETRGGDLFPSTDGELFKIDGKSQYYTGTNAYWLPRVLDSDDIDYWLDLIQHSGLKILRTWAFSDLTEYPPKSTDPVWFQALVPGKPIKINYGPTGLQRLDRVVRGAEKRGIKLILTLTNNFPDYGGMPAYQAYFGTNSTEGFYKTPRIQARYHQYIKLIVGRYKHSSAIFAWELANEARCKGCPVSVVTDWSRTTSAYIKSLDPYHMVTTGNEGMGLPGATTYPYTHDEGNDFVQQTNIDTIDFNTFHFYGDYWGVTQKSANKWVRDHAKVCRTAGKPCIFEEYGHNATHCATQSPWQQTALTTKGIGSSMFWQLGNRQDPFNDLYSIYPGTADFNCLVTKYQKEVDKYNKKHYP